METNTQIQQLIVAGTEQFLATRTSENLTKNDASRIATEIGKDRTYVSRYLNQCLKQRTVIKINTRPVIFLDVQTLQAQGKLKPVYTTEDELLAALDVAAGDSILKSIVGYNGSMKTAIEQTETSLAYPGTGLPMIIFGDSGVGKSFFAKQSYQYAKYKRILPATAPFVAVNCAQYANNPELLSSMLFGYVKGAFTGAETTQDGAFAAADGGVLFLDEVHRLSGEGQEKLFTYLDEGYYTRVGDNSTHRQVKVRLICATTESKQTFLETFLRRLPIQINISALNQRPVSEKQQLIDRFFKTEVQNFRRTITVSNRVMSTLLNYTFTENIGQLKSTIKYIVANAKVAYQDQPSLQVKLVNLPAWMYQKDKTAFTNVVSGQAQFTYRLDNQVTSPQKSGDRGSLMIQRTWEQITAKLGQPQVTKKVYVALIKDTMDDLVFSRPNESQNMLMQFFIDVVQRMLVLLNESNELVYDGNLVFGIATYLYDNTGLAPDYQPVTDVQLQSLIALFPNHYRVVQKMKTYLDAQTDRILTNADCLWLAVYLSTSNNLLSQEGKNLGIVITHGYATASSIASVCNRILHHNVFLAINMPLHATPTDIATKLQRVFMQLDSTQGVVIMFDMGSISQISEQIIRGSQRPILLIDKVSTAGALEVGNALVLGKSLTAVKAMINDTWLPQAKLHYPVAKKVNVIISVCMTGIGTARQIKAMLEKSFATILPLKVIATDFESLQNQGVTAAELSKYHVICIVGTDDPHLKETPYISLQSLITGDSTARFNQLLAPLSNPKAIQKINQNLIRNFSLAQVIGNLTILDTDTVMDSIERFINQIERVQQQMLTNKVKMTLFVHLSSMIERLIRNEPVDAQRVQECVNEASYSVVKSALSVIEKQYRIKVPDAEIAYIIDILKFK